MIDELMAEINAEEVSNVPKPILPIFVPDEARETVKEVPASNSTSDVCGETANLQELTSEGTCAVVLHPGDVLEYDSAEYFISEKDFQVKYERTKKSKKSFKSKKSTSLLKSMSNLVSGNGIDKQILTKKSLR